VQKSRASQQSGSDAGRKARLIVALGFFAVFAVTAALAVKFAMRQPGSASPPIAAAAKTPATSEMPTNEVAHALMVTVELDFGTQIPSVAQALKSIERRYEPADGAGRTFAILDAYGEPTPDHKLHLSMHVSLEKPGTGALVFRKTGEVLWKSRIVLAPGQEVTPLNKRTLLILVDDGKGKSLTIDGSNNPATILQANVKELGVPLMSIWEDGSEREFTYLYSACGCPVKAMVRREGEKTVRARELPVMFPDDPAALAVISRLMTWETRPTN